MREGRGLAGAEPVTATLLGVLVLREDVSVLTALGIAVVVLGLALMALPGRSGPSRGPSTAPRSARSAGPSSTASS